MAFPVIRLYRGMVYQFREFRGQLDCFYLSELNSMYTDRATTEYMLLCMKDVNAHIIYDDTETPDMPKIPEMTLFDGQGNCNDYSMIFLTLLKRYRPRIEACLLSVKYLDGGHCVCAFKLPHSGMWCFVSNTGFYETS